MSEAEIIAIPTMRKRIHDSAHVCTGDWMIECDGCGMRLPAIEAWRGLGPEGMAMARALLMDEGWKCDEATDVDLCSRCAADEEARS
jgi:adenine-specific DNA methylase